MRIRQIQMLPVRKSLRELLRTAITTLSPQASVNADDRSFDESFSIRDAACGILNIFPRKFPPTTFPRSTACTVARFTNHPSWMAMGMVSPDKNQLTNLKEVRTAYQIDGTYPIAQHRAT
jgi:hypothetical protein